MCGRFALFAAGEEVAERFQLAEAPLFVPFASDRMEAYPVSSWVSDPKHEGPRCLELADVF
jgi:putative SOS response-associated peptidase YedK